MGWKFDRSARLSVAIGVSFSFFLVEIAIGFKTHSIALIADAFHYLNDLISFIVALVAIVISEKPNGNSHKDLTYGWQRATLLGAFFNGVFLLALGISIFLQSIERFIDVPEIKDPMLIVIVGAIGLGLNIICMLFLHEHSHDHGSHHGHDHAHHHEDNEVPSGGHVTPDEDAISSSVPMPHRHSESGHLQHRHRRPSLGLETKQLDFGMAGVLLHLAGDAFNNIGVIIAGLVIWKSTSEHRYYADPAVSMAIALLILLSSLPLVRKSGHILLQSPPSGIDVLDIQHDLESIPGITSVHELHVWRLNQQKALATAHVVIDDPSLERFAEQVKTMNECFHAYGVHSATIQPELNIRRRTTAEVQSSTESAMAASVGDLGHVPPHRVARTPTSECQMSCGSQCEKMSCCG